MASWAIRFTIYVNQLSKTLTKPLYENCIVRNLSGDVMFHCNSKRANWYVSRNLATVIGNDPLDIQLNFKTKGNGKLGSNYFLQSMRNICVVCGIEKDLTRHHVFPFAFRKFLPEELKIHNHYDILLLCSQCHDSYEHHAYDFKRQLAKEYGAPLDGEFDEDKVRYYSDLRHSRHFARTLLNYSDKIPTDRKHVMMNFIKTTLSVDVISLDEVANMDVDKINVKTQGKIIIERLTNVEEFICRWRKHFVETMQPRFMPKFWSVDRK